MLKRVLIYLTAFVGGFVVMSFEILGNRMLAVSFGQTTYVLGALISVFLAALAVGYSVGGYLADKRCNLTRLGTLLLVPALYLLLLPWLRYPFCGAIAANMNTPRTAVLLAAVLLFSLPTMFLGSLTPYLVKFAIDDLDRVGRQSGLIFAIAAIGSISGTIVTSFFLIRLLGTTANTRLLSIPLALCAAAAIAFDRLSSGSSGTGQSPS